MQIHSTAPGTTSFMIMLALAAGEASGSEIFDRIVEDQAGDYVKMPTLYGDLRRLAAAGYVKFEGMDGPAKIYGLTSKGADRLEREVRFLGTLAATAKMRMRRLR